MNMHTSSTRIILHNPNLESCKEFEMLHYCESVKEYIVLGTASKAVSDLVHVAPDVIAIDDCCTSSWCVQT